MRRRRNSWRSQFMAQPIHERSSIHVAVSLQFILNRYVRYVTEDNQRQNIRLPYL